MKIQRLKTRDGYVCSGSHLFDLNCGFGEPGIGMTPCKHDLEKAVQTAGGQVMLVVGDDQDEVLSLLRAAARNNTVKRLTPLRDKNGDYLVTGAYDDFVFRLNAKKVAQWSDSADLWIVRNNGIVIR